MDKWVFRGSASDEATRAVGMCWGWGVSPPWPGEARGGFYSSRLFILLLCTKTGIVRVRTPDS